MSRYVSPYTDFGFKKLFGEEASKDLLIDFLNSLLPEKHQIKSLKFRNTEQLGPTSTDRRAVYDIFCEAKSGEKFIVEMQNSKQIHFKDRAVFYSSLAIREQAEVGEDWDFELTPVYFVGILNFVFDEKKQRRRFRENISLKDDDGEEFYENQKYIFLQMPLFTKTESELESRHDKWLYFLKNLARFDQIPAILREPIFEKAFRKAELARMTKKERAQYEANLKVLRDNNAMLKMVQVEARTERSSEIAQKMKKDGVEVKQIAKYTGLSVKEIKQLD